jgi:hypothetical protein
MIAKRAPIDSTTKDSEDGRRPATDRFTALFSGLAKSKTRRYTIEVKDAKIGAAVMFTTVDGTSEQKGMGVAQIRRVVGLPTDNGFTEANRAKFRLVALGILVIDVILFAALGGSAAGMVFAFIMVVTWILLAVAVKAGFGKRRPSPPKDPL